MTTATAVTVFAALSGLAKATDPKFKPVVKGEQDQAFLERFLEVLATAPERDFDELPEDAKKWYSEAEGFYNREEPLPLPEGFKKTEIAPKTEEKKTVNKVLRKPKESATAPDETKDAAKKVKPISLRGVATSTRDAFNVDPFKIMIEEGFNARDFELPENREHIDALKSSIKSVGVKTPLTVRVEADKVYLVDGECRLRAVSELISENFPIKTVPVLEEDKHANEADRVAALVIRNSGKGLTMLEQGDVYRRLLAFGWTEKEISGHTGMTPMHIDNCLKLYSAPVEIKQEIKSGYVAASTVVQTIRREGTVEGAETIKTAVKEAKDAGKKKVSGSAVKASSKTVSGAKGKSSNSTGLWVSAKKVKVLTTAVLDIIAKFPDHEITELLKGAVTEAKIPGVELT